MAFVAEGSVVGFWSWDPGVGTCTLVLFSEEKIHSIMKTAEVPPEAGGKRCHPCCLSLPPGLSQK